MTTGNLEAPCPRRRHYAALKRCVTGSLPAEDVRHLDNELLHRGLLRLGSGGCAEITEKGRQLVFQMECELTLSAVASGEVSRIEPQFANWLLAQRFVVEPCKSCPWWRVTPRGRAWLEVLTEPKPTAVTLD